MPIFADASPSAESNDFTLQSNSVSFIGTAGESKTVEVLITGDFVAEINEVFTVRMGTPTGSIVDPATIITSDTATGTITDNDDPIVTISTTSPGSEPGSIDIIFTSSHTVEGGFTISVSVTGGTAVQNTDFTFPDQTLMLSTVGVSVTATVTITNDAVVEGTETIIIGITGPGSTSIPTNRFTIPTSRTVNIIDSDTITILVDNASVEEGSGNLQFAVSASGVEVSSSYTLTLSVATIGTTSGADYTIGSNQVTITNPATSGIFTVTVENDYLVEPTETFTVRIDSVTTSDPTINPNRFTISDTGLGTITNDDSTTFTVTAPSPSSFDEEIGFVDFMVTSTFPVQGGITLNIGSAFLTAPAASAADISILAPTVLFSATTPNESHTVTVGITNDPEVEPNETFDITLSINTIPSGVSTSNVDVTDRDTGIILNMDSTTITSSPVSVNEEAGSMLFTLTLQNPVAGGFTLQLSTSPNAPTSAGDFTLVTTSLPFSGASGQTQQVSVNIDNDSIVEPTETFTLSGTVSVSSSVNTNFITMTPQTGSILNTDTPTVTINSVTQDEEITPMVFTVTLSHTVQGGATVNLAGTNIGVTSYGDYTVSTTSISFPASASQPANVAINNDAIVETNEEFNLITTSLTSGSFTISPAPIYVNGKGTITNTDFTTITVVDRQGFEGSTLAFDFISTNAVQGTFVVPIIATESSAFSPDDYSLVTPSVAFAGTVSEAQTASVSLVNDAVAEPTETFVMSMGTATSTSINPAFIIITDTAIGSILDNDPFISSIVNNGPIGEGSEVVVTVSFSDPNPSNTDTYSATVNWGNGSPTVAVSGPINTSGTTAVTGTVIARNFYYADNGVYTITITISDGNGGTVAASTTITISNVAPTLGTVTTTTGDEGILFTFTSAFNDRGTADTHTFTVDFGDGTAVATGTVTESPSAVGSSSGTTGSGSASHFYADNGIYTVSYCIRDDDAGNLCATRSITINNRVPVLIGSVTASASNSVVSVQSFDVRDLGSLDLLTGTIAWGDGTSSTLSITQNRFGPPGQASGQIATITVPSHTYTYYGYYYAKIGRASCRERV